MNHPKHCTRSQTRTTPEHLISFPGARYLPSTLPFLATINKKIRAPSISKVPSSNGTKDYLDNPRCENYRPLHSRFSTSSSRVPVHERDIQSRLPFSLGRIGLHSAPEARRTRIPPSASRPDWPFLMGIWVTDLNSPLFLPVRTL